MPDNRYNFHYPIVLTPLRSDVNIDFTSEEAKNAFNAAVLQYNRASSASRTCPKEITDVDFHKKQICVTLLATDVIKSPGRALRTLSLKLIEHAYFANILSEDHKLFTTIYEKFPDENTNETQNIKKDILLKCVTDVVFAEENTVTNNILTELDDLCARYHLKEKYI